MENNGRKAAFARPYSVNDYYDRPDEREAQVGLTKREYFAAMMMQALVNKCSEAADAAQAAAPIAEDAVRLASALLAELEKGK